MAAQASPQRACWGAEISFGLKTYTRTDLVPGWVGWQDRQFALTKDRGMKLKWIYWVSTGLLAAIDLGGGTLYRPTSPVSLLEINCDSIE